MSGDDRDHTVPGAAGRLVTLRRAGPDDADRIASWRADPIARRYQPLQHRTPDQFRARLTDQGSHQLCPTATADFLWIVESSAGPVGWVSLKEINPEHGTGAIGYTIASDAHRRGYATAAVRQLVSLAFSPIGSGLGTAGSGGRDGECRVTSSSALVSPLRGLPGGIS